jgi:glyoxalase superfamily protein
MARLRNITMDCENPGQLASFWQAATGYSIEFSNEWIANLAPPEAGAPHILLIKVPEPKSTKNRTHVDLDADDREAEVARLEQLGATRGETHSMQKLVWTVMQDPEGNEFCVAQAVD